MHTPAATVRSLIRSSARAFVLACGAVASLAGCAGDGPEIVPESAERIVVEAPTSGAAEAAAPDVLARAEQALASAEAAWREGDALSALAIANRALREGVPPEMEPRFRELRARARGSVLASRVVRVRAVPLRDVVASGEPVPVRILVRNLTAAVLRAPLTAPGSSDALLVLEVRREDFDVYGNRRTSEFTVRAPLPGDLVVPPGAEREFQVSIAADLVTMTHEGVTVVHVGGAFRPVSIRVGETEIFDAVRVEPAPVRVLAQGWEPLAEDPLESLRRAVHKRSPAHVMTCAELLAPAERDAARASLRLAAEADPELAPFLRTVLARLDEIDRPQAVAADAPSAPAASSAPGKPGAR